MLRYLSSGMRNKNSRPWRAEPEIRRNWEFMAILKGHGRPLRPSGEDYKFHSKRLWIMPPMSEHHWRVRENEQCEVVVMHFSSLPDVMQSFISYETPTSVPLSASDIATIRKVHDEVRPHYEHPGIDCIVWFEKALIDLCILVVTKTRHAKAASPDGDHTLILEKAFDWYRLNLPKSADIEDISKVLDVPVSHLRRIFRVRLNETMTQAFRRLALEEACKLMVKSSLSLKEIANHCGFARYAHFYRAFQCQFHVPPTEWRENRFYGKQGFKSHRN